MPQPTLQPPKPIGLNYNLNNPYSQPKPTGGGGIVNTNYYTKPKPTDNVVTVGNVKVETKNPVVVQGSATPPIQDPVKSTGFWAKKTNKQKMMFIGVGVVAVIAIIAFSRKK